MDHLIGLGVSVSDYWPRGRRFNCRQLHNFKYGLSLERGPPSLMKTIGWLFDREVANLFKKVDINRFDGA